MDTDKAYLLGLIIGGGVFGNAEDVFSIRLPYKKWGSYLENPQRAGEIAGDILRRVGQMFRAVYDLSVQYETTPGGTWTILCEGDTTAVKNDLMHYGIVCEGELRGSADISQVVLELVDDNLKRRFIAGLADTIGSMAKSQRRFTDEHQIISFEIKGYNFKFVCDLCRLLYSINCIPDQVNWNHPNIHCTNDSYYAQWNKGFKLRILLDQYAQFGAFAFRTKAETSNENRRLQRETHAAERCETRDMHFTPSTVHPAENDTRLPELIRGGHYIHFRHFCTVMGCEHAPYCKIREQFEHIGELINPFPILHKDSYIQIEEIIQADPLLSGREYTSLNVNIGTLIDQYKEDKTALLYGTTANTGYPIAEILQAVAYVIANDDELSGKRPKGYFQIVERHSHDDADLSVEIRKPDLLTPLVIVGNGRGALIGARNPNVYKRLVTISPDNEYKLLVRQITEEDLRDAR
mgnify:FL=1